MPLAFNTQDPTILENRWIASLSDGSTVFQNAGQPGEESAWLQLRHHVEANKLRITNLRLQAHGQFISLRPHAQGYWQANRITATMGEGQQPQEVTQRGVGHLMDGIIHITWVAEDGHLSEEVRVYDSTKELGVIS